MTQTIVDNRYHYHCDRAVQITDDVVGEVAGYVAVWGDASQVDSYGTFFAKDRPPEMDLDMGMHRRPIKYEHAQDGALRFETVGVIDRIWFDDTGIAYRGHLDRSSPFFERIVAELRGGVLKTSSATMSHTADFYDDGAFRVWTLGELSFTKDPAEPRMPASRLVRSNAEVEQDAPRAGDETDYLTDSISPQEERNMATIAELLQQIEAGQGPDAAGLVAALMESGYTMEELAAAMQQTQPPVPPEGETMSAPVMLSRYVQAISTAADAYRAQRQVADQVAAQRQTMEAELRRRQMAEPPATDPHQRSASRPNVPVISDVRDLRTAHLTAGDMAFIHQSLEARGRGVKPDFIKAMGLKLAQAAERNDPAACDLTTRSAFPLANLRANEIMQSDLAGQGDEWVGVFYSNELWEKTRMARIYQTMKAKGMWEFEVPQGFESTWVPLEGNDPTWYTTEQARDVDSTNRPEVTVKASFPGTDRVQVTPGEVSAFVIYNDTFDEDSLIPVAPQLNRQLSESGEDMIEYVMINGDVATTANTNINLVDDTPATGLSRPRYLVTDGILKLALVTNTANARQGTTLTEEDFLLTQALLSDELMADDEKQFFLSDVRTFQKARSIPAFMTRDVYGDPTLEGGKLMRPWGVDYLKSGQMALANTAGKISATPANNTKGRLVSVYAPYWAFVWKRRTKVETDRDILSGSNLIVARMRFAVRSRSIEAAALTYDLTV